MRSSTKTFKFVDDNEDHAGFVSRLDTHSITKQVTRVKGSSEDALEVLYDRRRRKALEQKGVKASFVQIDPVDALPVKTMDEQAYDRTHSKDVGDEERNEDKNMVKLTKSDMREKLKRVRKRTRNTERNRLKLNKCNQFNKELQWHR